MKQYQLPKEFAEKWVSELRSGKYQQIHQAFSKGENCLCALGVAHVSQGCGIIKIADDDYIMDDFGKDVPCYGPLYNDIVKLNDVKLLQFPEIADWITENVEFI